MWQVLGIMTLVLLGVVACGGHSCSHPPRHCRRPATFTKTIPTTCSIDYEAHCSPVATWFRREDAQAVCVFTLRAKNTKPMATST